MSQERNVATHDEHGHLTCSSWLISPLRSGPHELHDRFEWDDSLAADRYRSTGAAAGPIRSVKITVQKTPDAQPISVRAFISDSEIRTMTADTKRYMPVERVVESDVLRSVPVLEAGLSGPKLTRRGQSSQSWRGPRT